MSAADDGEAMPSLVLELIRERRQDVGLNQLKLAETARRRPEHDHPLGEGPQSADVKKCHPQKLALVLGGIPSDYRWTEADFAERDRRTKLRLEINRLTRQLENDSDSDENDDSPGSRKDGAMEAWLPDRGVSGDTVRAPSSPTRSYWS
jgi:hypothetical protein